MMQAILTKIGDVVVAAQNGSPPAPSVSDAAPIANVDTGDVSGKAGETVAFTVTLTPDAAAAMCKLFAKIGGSNSFFTGTLQCPAGKLATQVGVPVQVPIQITLPDPIEEGRFCLEFSGQDNADLVSNVATVCVNVIGPSDTPNASPNASVGPTQNVNAGEPVALDASGSTDGDGTVASFQWLQIHGPTVVLQGANTATPTFTAPAQGGVFVFTVTVTDNQGNQDHATVKVVVAPAPANPTVTLTATPASIAGGASSTLQWSSTGATACVASGAWSGSKPTSGSESVTPSATSTYTLTCSGAAGTTAAHSSATVTLTTPPSPSVTISVAPSTVNPTESATLQWSSTDATDCTASGAWSGTQPTSGSLVVSQSSPGSYGYTLTCNGATGTSPAQGTATLTVRSPAKPTLSFDLSPSSITTGQSAQLSWTSTNTTSCTASNTWSGSEPLSGFEVVTQQTAGSYVYTLTCQGATGTTPVTRSRTLTVSAQPPPPAKPTVNLTSNTAATEINNDLILTWTSSNATSCAASGAWSGAQPTSGTQTIVAGSRGNNVFTLTCSGTSGSGSDSALVVVDDTGLYGRAPESQLLELPDGRLVGKALDQGSSPSDGVIFAVTPAGVPSLLWSIPPLGSVGPQDAPDQRLMLYSDGNIYGLDRTAGASDSGAVIQVSPSGGGSIIHEFTGSPDGAFPLGALADGLDGFLYGATQFASPLGGGSLFQIAPDGTYAQLYPFDNSGIEPRQVESGLILHSDGNFYGSTFFGGGSDEGTVFSANSIGSVAPPDPIYHFGNNGPSDGQNPSSALIEGTDGNLYGVTNNGGTAGLGTVFQLTTGGTETTVCSFQGGTSDGANPISGLIQASDGNFYGVTSGGGQFGGGVVFRATNSLVAPCTILHSFSAGEVPYGGVIEGSDGNFYGTIRDGGANGRGAVYQLTPGGGFKILFNF